MSSQVVKQSREPPSAELAHSSALDVVNNSFADSAHLDDLQRILDDAHDTKVQLEQQVRVAPTRLSVRRSSLHSLSSQRKRSPI